MDPSTVVIAVAWLVVLAGAVSVGVGLLRGTLDSPARTDTVVCLALAVLAFALRVALPSGPLDFAEAERLQGLWGTRAVQPPTFQTLPLLLTALRHLNIPPWSLLRITGPFFGALAVGGVYVLGRTGDLPRPAAALGACVLLGFPAHVHFSTSVGLSIEGPALWVLASAAALSTLLHPAWRVSLVAALTVLGVYTRPEYRLLVLAMVPLVFAPHWTWRQRSVLGVVLAVSLASYVRYIPVAHLAGDRSDLSRYFLPWVFQDLRVNPAWWLIAGVLGLALGRLPWTLRLSLSIATGGLLLAYGALASDANPLWGQWRYDVSVLPFVAVGVGALAAGMELPPRMTTVLSVLTVLSVGVYFPVLRRRDDLPTELGWIRSSAPRVLGSHPTVLVLSNRRHGRESRVLAESTVLLALGTSVGAVDWPRRCDEGASRLSAVDVRDLEDWVLRCPGREGFDPTRAVVYLGLYRPDERLSAVTEHWRWLPLEEHTVTVVPSVPAVDTGCRVPAGTLEGSATRDCTVRLGWYRLAPR